MLILRLFNRHLSSIVVVFKCHPHVTAPTTTRTGTGAWGQQHTKTARWCCCRCPLPCVGAHRARLCAGEFVTEWLLNE